ncbi:MAG: uroporphyrinogen decarboxylase [Deltaproteobacteria bacterium]|nr:uroporphyrinogen decarboxylase [Deltaproteobacteria bacterium]
MSDDIQKQFNDRLARYQAAIALEMPDRIPISAGSNYFAEIYAGNTNQEFIYNSDQWIESDRRFVRDFPEVDNLRSGRLWGPYIDAVGWNMYKLPGREISPTIQFQFIEGERMKKDEYDLLIRNPAEFIFERVLPRVFNEFAERGSMRSYIAFLKAGMGAMMMGDLVRKRFEHLEKELGMPLPMVGSITSPFDCLADGLRGLNGIMVDIFKQPDKVKEACDAIVPHIVNIALSSADPLRRYPIHMPLHRGCRPFLSPRQFDEFYWPPLKKTMMMLIDAGYTIRPYLEGDWGSNWYHFRELPRGKLLLDIDGPGDIHKAKEELGDWQCIAGGVPDSTLILGTPEDVRSKVKHLCETVGKDGGYIINGGNGIPYDTKPENYRAMIDAVLEYGRYKDTIDFEPLVNPNPPQGWTPLPKGVITPWEDKLRELGEIQGNARLIREGWELFENRAFYWLWTWIW